MRAQLNTALPSDKPDAKKLAGEYLDRAVGALREVEGLWPQLGADFIDGPGPTTTRLTVEGLRDRVAKAVG